SCQVISGIRAKSRRAPQARAARCPISPPEPETERSEGFGESGSLQNDFLSVCDFCPRTSNPFPFCQLAADGTFRCFRLFTEDFRFSPRDGTRNGTQREWLWSVPPRTFGETNVSSLPQEPVVSTCSNAPYLPTPLHCRSSWSR